MTPAALPAAPVSPAAPPDRSAFIPLYRPFLAGREKEYVNRCLDSTWISSKGEFIGRFEAAFAAYVGAGHAASVCNGTAAVHAALKALGLGPGDEVIVPTLTYIASVNPIRLAGATPVFADSIEETWQLDPEDVRRRLTPRTKAVLAVHLYGRPCDMDALGVLCREKNLLLVEDCAEAFGARWRGRHVGTFGDAATFSFFGNKTLTTGEGGMVVSRTREIHERVIRLKTQGVSPSREYWHEVEGYNYRMTNLCAALGLAQLEQADEILRLKRRVAGWYAEGLAGLPLRMQEEAPGTQESFWLCSVVLDDAAKVGPARASLAAAGVESRPFFPPVHTLPPYAPQAQGAAFPVAQSLSARGISLPSFPGLTEDEAARVCAALRKSLA